MQTENKACTYTWLSRELSHVRKTVCPVEGRGSIWWQQKKSESRGRIFWKEHIFEHKFCYIWTYRKLRKRYKVCCQWEQFRSDHYECSSLTFKLLFGLLCASCAASLAPPFSCTQYLFRYSVLENKQRVPVLFHGVGD